MFINLLFSEKKDTKIIAKMFCEAKYVISFLNISVSYDPDWETLILTSSNSFNKALLRLQKKP